MVIKLNIAVCW